MFYGLAIGVHLKNINARNPTIERVIVEQIDEMDMRPDIVLNGDDPVDNDQDWDDPCSSREARRACRERTEVPGAKSSITLDASRAPLAERPA